MSNIAIPRRRPVPGNSGNTPASYHETSERATSETQVLRGSRGAGETPETQVPDSKKANSSRRYETVDAKDFKRVVRAKAGEPGQRYVGLAENSTAGAWKSATRLENDAGRGVGDTETNARPGAKFEEYRNAEDTNHDSDEADESDASVDSLEARLVEYRQAEFKKSMDKGNLEEAHRIVEAIMESLDDTQTAEIAEWKGKLAYILLHQMKPKDAIEVLDDLQEFTPETMCVWGEAHFLLGNMEEARKSFASTIKATRKSKEPDMVKTTQWSMFAMSETLEALGKKVDAGFYRAQVHERDRLEFCRPRPDGYNPFSKREEQTASNPVKEKKKPEKITLSEASKEVMVKFSLKVDSTGTRLVGRNPDLVGAFEEAMLIGKYNDLLETLLEVPALHSLDTGGCGPLFFAARYMSSNVIRKLLEKGADPNRKTAPGCYTALHELARRSYNSRLVIGPAIEAADILLSYGADVNSKDYKGNTPLHTASILGNEQFVRWLLKSGAEVGIVNSDGHSAIQVANDSVMSRLMQASAIPRI